MAGGRTSWTCWTSSAPRREGIEKIAHPGTFNANPVSAAAGIATLEILSSTDACAKANAFGETMRRQMNEVLEDEGVKWAVHGSYSGMHIFTNPDGADITPSTFDRGRLHPDDDRRQARRRDRQPTLRMGMLVNGVDMNSGPVRHDLGDARRGRDGHDGRCLPHHPACVAPRRGGELTRAGKQHQHYLGDSR